MKKILALFVFLLSVSLQSMAQMTDAQIVEYVKEHNDRGEDQKEIALGLMRLGVSQEQLMRLRSQYQQMQNFGSLSMKGKNVSDYRMRSANGETVPDVNSKQKKDTKSAKYTIPTNDLMLDDNGYGGMEEVENEDKVKIFGHDIFRSDKLTFQPNVNVPAPQSYVLGPGDEVILDIYGATQLSNVTKVAPDGSVAIPDERPVYVAGLTLSQAQTRIRKAIGGNYAESTIKVSLGQTRTIQVNIMGEVATPGTYSLSAFSSVFNALYLAGGVNEIGTLRNIKVSRKGRIVTTIDVYEFIMNGRLPGNIVLQDEDVIIVGTYESLVKIEGNVKRPMYYEMKKTESLQSLLHYAGGFTGDAYKEKVRVERRSSEGLTVHNVDEWDFSTFHSEDEDIVVVAPIIERYKNVVKVRGAVFRPGNYRIDDKVNTIKDAIEQAGGLLEQAVTSRVVLLRLKEDRTLITQSIPLQDILDGKEQDVILHNEDEIIISSYTRKANNRKMYIYGEVMSPGVYNFSENTSIGDLITMAGGTNDVASLQKVEVSRRITTDADNNDGKQLAKVFMFDLNDNLEAIGHEQFRLEPNDKVVVHRSPNNQLQRTVYIGGEVMYEGWYTMSSKDDKLASLLERAGGLTVKANASGASLVRRYTDPELQERQKMLSVANTMADSIAINAEINKKHYRVGINLAAAQEKPDGASNITLEAGDSIYIPQQSEVVKISGEVLSPNTVTYMKNKSSRYYLNQAGGITENGKKSKAYVLYANGQISTLRKGRIEPGCEIVVPTKVEKKIDTSKVSMWATLASTTATIAAVISSVLR